MTNGKSVTADGVDAAVAYDGRRNRQDQVTGFILNRLSGLPVYAGIGECTANKPNIINYALVSDSINNEGGDPLLQVSIDGVDALCDDLEEQLGSEA